MMQRLFSADVKEILALKRKERFTDGWTENMMYASFDSGNYHVFGVKEGNKIIGIISFTFCTDYADILEVLVDSNYRNRGLGLSLVEFMQDFIKKQGVSKIFLEVRASNVPAINLYKKAGFSEISQRKKYYEDGEDAIILAKE